MVRKTTVYMFMIQLLWIVRQNLFYTKARSFSYSFNHFFIHFEFHGTYLLHVTSFLSFLHKRVYWNWMAYIFFTLFILLLNQGLWWFTILYHQDSSPREDKSGWSRLYICRKFSLEMGCALNYKLLKKIRMCYRKFVMRISTTDFDIGKFYQNVKFLLYCRISWRLFINVLSATTKGRAQCYASLHLNFHEHLWSHVAGKAGYITQTTNL